MASILKVDKFTGISTADEASLSLQEVLQQLYKQE